VSDWCYRVVRLAGGRGYVLREGRRHGDGDVRLSHAPVDAWGASLAELRDDLARMLDACAEPVLDEDTEGLWL
jgi:hypothetical protein